MIEEVRSKADGFQKLIEQGVFVRPDDDGRDAPVHVHANLAAPDEPLNAGSHDPVAEEDSDDDEADVEPAPAAAEVPVAPAEGDLHIVHAAAVEVLSARTPSPQPVPLVNDNAPAIPIEAAADAERAPLAGDAAAVDASAAGEAVPPGSGSDRADSPPPVVEAPAAAAVAAPPPASTYTRICRDCSHSLFISRLYDWWANERADVSEAHEQMLASKDVQLEEPPVVTGDSDGNEDGNGVAVAVGGVQDAPVVPPEAAAAPAGEEKFDGLPVWVLSKDRKDCEDGRHCARQYETGHARQCE